MEKRNENGKNSKAKRRGLFIGKCYPCQNISLENGI